MGFAWYCKHCRSYSAGRPCPLCGGDPAPAFLESGAGTPGGEDQVFLGVEGEPGGKLRPLPPVPSLRPVPSPRAPDLEQHRAILAELLEVERARLAEARALEQRRGFIFPETTVIARDVARLSAAVHLGTGEGQGGGAGAGGREDTGAADRPDDPEPIPDTDRAGADPEAAALRALGVGAL